MAEPGREPVPGIVLHRLHLGGGAERVRHTLGCALVVGREADPHMAVVEDGVVRAVGLFDLVQRLRDQERLEPVAGHEGQRALKEIEPTERREFVEHEQDPMAPVLGVKVFGQPSADLVQHQSDQRLGAADVRRRHHEIERRRSILGDQVGDAPVAAPCDLRDDRVAIEAKKRHGGREHARSLVVGFVEELARGGGHDGMRSRLGQMRRGHHRLQRRLDRTLGIGEEGGDACEGLIRLGVEDMQDGADQQRVAGLFPVVAALQRTFGVNQDVGDVLHIADFPFAAPHFEQRIIGGRCGIGRVE